MKQSSKISLKASFRAALLLFILLAPLFWPGMPPSVGAEALSGENAVEKAQEVATTASSCPVGRKCLYFPFVKSPESSIDLVLKGIEVTQAVQDEQNTVPLIAGRATVLRIYAQSGGNARPLSNIKVIVTATRSGAALSGAPQALTTSLPITVNRSNYASSINIPLPSSWQSGTVDLSVRLDPENNVRESNEQNNIITRRLAFNPIPPLKIKIVPVKYTHTPNSRVFPAPTQDSISEWIRKTYPISQIEISWHTPYPFVGNLSKSEDFVRLLNEVTALKSSEGAPVSQVYYALVPVSDGSSSWFYGGIAGIGWVGSRTSVGLNTNSSAAQIAAHEIGHNMGMSHTPCGSTAGADANFPYEDGSIGQYGLDITTGTLYSPAENKDFMSYCNPKWVSDYTYKILYQSQSRVGADVFMSFSPETAESSASKTMLVRARISPDGAELLPAYVLPGEAAANPEPGDYRLQIFGMQDELLVDIPLSAYGMEMEGEELQGIHAVVPLPAAPAARLRLMKGDQVLDEQPVRVLTTDKLQGMSVEATPDGYAVRWSAVDQPALVRYTTDNGKTWTTLSVDQMGGQMEINAASLPEPGGTFDVVLSDTWR